MEIKIFLVWYLMLFAFGIIGLPLSSFLFKNWQDKGYAFSKLIGLFMVGIGWWFLSSIRILPFNETIGWILFIVSIGASLFYLYKKNFKFTKYMLVEEILFFLTLVFWAFIRSHNPRTEGTEKMMNLAFMNSINRTEFFPPLDPWLANGGNINYYYIGHYFFVIVGKLGNIAMSYVYNFALITIIAQTFIGLFSIFLELFRKGKEWIKLSFATLGALWICYAGNLHMAYNWLASYFQGTEFKYFFPDSTRIIPFTINEYPAYSIVLGDVHGHYIGLPFLVLILGLALVAMRKRIDRKSKFAFNAIISPVIVALYGINSWDMITAVFIFTVIHLYQVINSNHILEKKIKYFMLAEASLLLPGLILMLPYLINYKPAIGPEGGFPLGIVPFRTKSDPLPWLQFWFQFLLAPLLFMVALKLKVVKEQKLKIYSLLLTMAAICLIIGVEFLFIKDIFHKSNPPYFRTNTVFKFYYHAWVIFGIAAVSFIYAILHDEGESLKEKLSQKQKKINKSFKTAVFAIASMIFAMTFIYIFVAIKDFYPINNENVVRTMDGIDYIRLENPADYKAILWLNQNVKVQAVILEEVGDAYTYSARVSSTTGLVTVIGWPTHEWQWRGTSEIPFSRKSEVDNFYNGVNEEEVDKEFLQKYEVQYIFVGKKEKTTYPSLDEEKIRTYGEVVYDEDGTFIVKVSTDFD
jgi:uncharacterized membrane protein